MRVKGPGAAHEAMQAQHFKNAGEAAAVAVGGIEDHRVRHRERGTVGEPPITPDFMLRLAHAVGRVLKRSEARPTVLIGKDTRISGYMLESALESGFNSAGVDVVLLGPLPTPGVAYLTRAQRASLGVVISASHNPFDDNGIKFFSAQGSKLPDAWEQSVEEALAQLPVWEASAQLGKAKRLDDAAGRYIEFCKSTFAPELTLKGLKIVVDGAHGAAYQIAPKVFHELGAEVIAIGCAPDGLNINKDVGATHPQALVAAVRQHGAHFGVALDGDADRLQIVDAQGRLYNGDELLYLMADERLARGEALGGVVGTLMTNMAVELALKARGLEFARARVGDGERERDEGQGEEQDDFFSAWERRDEERDESEGGEGGHGGTAATAD